MRVLLALVGAVLLVPCASAGAYVHGWLEPREHELTLAAGGRTTLTYEWHVVFENTTCASAAEVGVDFIVGESPVWAGASFRSPGERAFAPRRDGQVGLDVAVESEPTQDLHGTILLAIGLNQYDWSSCTPSPMSFAERANLTVHVQAETSSGATGGGGGTPAPPAWMALVALGWVARRLDGFHRNWSPGRF